jgi:hypothetical protein
MRGLKAEYGEPRCGELYVTWSIWIGHKVKSSLASTSDLSSYQDISLQEDHE